MHWEPRIVLWTMNVEQLVWWWTQAWALQNRLRGVDPEKKKQGTAPDREALHKAYPELAKTGVVRG